MAKYQYINGKRIGKIGGEVYYVRVRRDNVQTKSSYVPVNNAWITKERFKEYVLSLLDKGIPEIYILEELPEEMFPYALIFIQKGERVDIYLDKDGIRTEVNIEGSASDIDRLEGLINDVSDSVNELRETINSLSGSITTLTSDVNTLKTDVNTLKSDLFDVINYVNTLLNKAIYEHNIHYDASGRGEVNFTLYNSLSTRMTIAQMASQLGQMGCTAYWNGHPASGEGINGGIVTSVYAANNMVYVDIQNLTAHTQKAISEFNSGQIDTIRKIY